MNVVDKIIKSDLIQIVILIIMGFALILSTNLLLNILIGLSIIAFELWVNYNKRVYKNKLLSELNEKQQVYMTYKESNKYTLFLLIMLLFNITSSIKRTIDYKNIELISNNKNEINNIIEFVKIGSFEDIASIIGFIVILILIFLKFVQCLKGVVTVYEDKIIFTDETVIDISQIKSIEYTHRYFCIRKRRILKIYTDMSIKYIIVDLNDDKLKSYIERKLKKYNNY